MRIQKTNLKILPGLLSNRKTVAQVPRQFSNTRVYPNKRKRFEERPRYYFLQDFLRETNDLPVADKVKNRAMLSALGTRWQGVWERVFETFHRFNHLDSTFRHMLRRDVDLTWGYFEKDATPVQRAAEMEHRREVLREICQARPRDLHQERGRFAAFMKFADPDLHFLRNVAGFFREVRVKAATAQELNGVVSDILSIESAFHEIAMANLRLMHRLVKQFSSDKLTYLDFVLEGYFGLLSAVGRFNQSQGSEFSTYASWWVRQALQGAYERLRPCGISLERIQLRKTLAKEYQDLWQKTQGGGLGTPEELLRMAQVDLDLQRLRVTQLPISLQGDLSRRSTGFTLLHVVPVANEEDREIYRAELLGMLEDKVRELPSPNREIIIHRFGLFGNVPLSLEATAVAVQGLLGKLVTREAISQRQDSAIRTLFATSDLFRAFSDLFGVPQPRQGRSNHVARRDPSVEATADTVVNAQGQI